MTEPAKETTPADPLIPRPATVRSIEPETPGVATYCIEPADRQARHVHPGQFFMIYLPGVGEMPISVSGLAGEGAGIGFTIRAVGRVTRALAALGPGGVVGLRGPYGAGWPMVGAEGRDVLVVAGGLGIAPLRMAIRELLAGRGRFGRPILVYGARQPADLLYRVELEEWAQQGLEVVVTVDHADPDWRGQVGVVPQAMSRLRLRPERTLMMTCGPEIMMRFAIAEARADGVADRDIYLSLERNMQCAVGLCGHCQLGPEFVCKDGPVLSYPRVARFLNHEHF
jgi:NAD(P)H-flavin reductase